MMRFKEFEAAGPRFAFMSDKGEGDCSSRDQARGNVQALLERAGCRPERLIRLRQVHGNRILEACEVRTASGAEPPEADGVISGQSGVALGISVADCTPVLLFDPVSRAVAALHAGREGTFQNIAAAGVNALSSRFGSVPASLYALVGPCAGPCCYEVSEECAARWREAGLPCGGRNLNLPESNRLQLEKAGLFRHNIHLVPHCTVCGDLFFSYRAGEVSNRNLVVVML